MTNEEWLAKKLEAWYRSCYNAAWDAGGNPDTILEGISPEVTITMARNNIHLVYKGKDNND